MTSQNDEDLNQSLVAINTAIKSAYFHSLTSLSGSTNLPSNEMIAEAKSDLEEILRFVEDTDTGNSVLRIKKYAEIIDLLDKISPEDFLRNEMTKEYAQVLESFIYNYSAKFKEIISGNRTKMMGNKYELITAKSALQADIDAGTGNRNTKELVEIGNKYLELLKIAD